MTSLPKLKKLKDHYNYRSQLIVHIYRLSWESVFHNRLDLIIDKIIFKYSAGKNEKKKKNE